MTEKEKEALQNITESIASLLRGVIPDKVAATDCDSPEIKLLSDACDALTEKLAEAQDFTIALSRGDLDMNIPRGNFLLSPFKQLHANLRHLTWQTLQVAKGDLNHQVDFLGEFSDAFNSLIVSLKEKNKLENELRNVHDKITLSNQQLRQEIAERERTENELKRYSEKLKEKNQELQDFAHIASHDLQEPLRKVMAFGDRIKIKYAGVLDEQGKDYLERMQGATRRMQTFINDLLAFARVTTKAQPFAFVDLGKVANEVISDLEVRIQQTGGRVDLGALPTIEADALQMRQLLQNLIGNALKFHKKDEPPVIKVNGRFVRGRPGEHEGIAPEDEYCELIFEDNGIGFDEQYTERIFGIFQRLHGRSEYEGSGVGLAICKKIVERHRGNIIARGVPGKGAKFIIELPVEHMPAVELNDRP